MKLVKNLLIYSQYSYIEIASYLGFSSQSYLGQQFKKLTGFTLKEYRDRYGVSEFKTPQHSFVSAHHPVSFLSG